MDTVAAQHSRLVAHPRERDDYDEYIDSEGNFREFQRFPTIHGREYSDLDPVPNDYFEEDQRRQDEERKMRAEDLRRLEEERRREELRQDDTRRRQIIEAESLHQSLSRHVDVAHREKVEVEHFSRSVTSSTEHRTVTEIESPGSKNYREFLSSRQRHISREKDSSSEAPKKEIEESYSQFSEFGSDKDGAYGCGISFAKTAEGCVVRHVDNGSIAQENGVLIGDRLVKIDSLSIAEMRPREIESNLLGEMGSLVRLTLFRAYANGRTAQYEVTVKRGGQASVEVVSSQRKLVAILFAPLFTFRAAKLQIEQQEKDIQSMRDKLQWTKNMIDIERERNQRVRRSVDVSKDATNSSFSMLQHRLKDAQLEARMAQDEAEMTSQDLSTLRLRLQQAEAKEDKASKLLSAEKHKRKVLEEKLRNDSLEIILYEGKITAEEQSLRQSEKEHTQLLNQIGDLDASAYSLKQKIAALEQELKQAGASHEEIFLRIKQRQTSSAEVEYKITQSQLLRSEQHQLHHQQNQSQSQGHVVVTSQYSMPQPVSLTPMGSPHSLLSQSNAAASVQSSLSQQQVIQRHFSASSSGGLATQNLSSKNIFQTASPPVFPAPSVVQKQSAVQQQVVATAAPQLQQQAVSAPRLATPRLATHGLATTQAASGGRVFASNMSMSRSTGGMAAGVSTRGAFVSRGGFGGSGYSAAGGYSAASGYQRGMSNMVAGSGMVGGGSSVSQYGSMGGGIVRGGFGAASSYGGMGGFSSSVQQNHVVSRPATSYANQQYSASAQQFSMSSSRAAGVSASSFTQQRTTSSRDGISRSIYT